MDQIVIRKKKYLFEQVKLYYPEILWIENLSMVSFDWLTQYKEQVKEY